MDKISETDIYHLFLATLTIYVPVDGQIVTQCMLYKGFA